MAKTFKIIGNDISDGYHTFAELYDHRCLLYLNWCLETPNACSWRPDFEGWFLLYRETSAGQISYHLPNTLLPLIEGKIEHDDDAKWDGHSSQDVANRLMERAKEICR